MSSEAKRLFSSANKLNHKRRGSNRIRAASLAASAALMVAGAVVQKDKNDDKNELPKTTSDEPVTERQKTSRML
jgi:hypothetical protein